MFIVNFKLKYTIITGLILKITNLRLYNFILTFMILKVRRVLIIVINGIFFWFHEHNIKQSLVTSNYIIPSAGHI